MVVYNEHWQPFSLGNLGDWSRGDWKVLARSWFGQEAHLCGPADWEAACPDAGSALEIKGRSMAVLVSDNDWSRAVQCGPRKMRGFPPPQAPESAGPGLVTGRPSWTATVPLPGAASPVQRSRGQVISNLPALEEHGLP
jgi:hypothetical protein